LREKGGFTAAETQTTPKKTHTQKKKNKKSVIGQHTTKQTKTHHAREHNLHHKDVVLLCISDVGAGGESYTTDDERGVGQFF